MKRVRVRKRRGERVEKRTYFATSLAVAPSLVMTMIMSAFTLCAVLTAVEARDSKGAMGAGLNLMMSLKRL